MTTRYTACIAVVGQARHETADGDESSRRAHRRTATSNDSIARAAAVLLYPTNFVVHKTEGMCAIAL